MFAAELIIAVCVLAVCFCAANLRLVAVQGHPRSREWSWRVRNTIAHTLVPLDGAGEVLIAGDKPWEPLGVLSDDNGTVPLSLGQRSPP